MTSVADITSKMESKFNPAAAAGLDLVFQFNIEDDSNFNVTIKDGTCAIAQGDAATPNVTLIMDKSTLEGVMTGETDGMQAFMAGKLRAEGDMMFLTWLFAFAFDLGQQYLHHAKARGASQLGRVEKVYKTGMFLSKPTGTYSRRLSESCQAGMRLMPSAQPRLFDFGARSPQAGGSRRHAQVPASGPGQRSQIAWRSAARSMLRQRLPHPSSSAMASMPSTVGLAPPPCDDRSNPCESKKIKSKFTFYSKIAPTNPIPTRTLISPFKQAFELVSAGLLD